MLARPQAWIEQAISKIGQQIEEYDDYTKNQHRSLNGWQVAAVDRFDVVAAQPRPGEHRFNNDGAANQSAELIGYDCDKGTAMLGIAWRNSWADAGRPLDAAVRM